MDQMTLAEKVACDFQRDNAALLEQIKEISSHRKAEMEASRIRAGLIGHFKTCIRAWLQRLEIGTPEELDHMEREMRKVLEKIDRELAGIDASQNWIGV